MYKQKKDGVSPAEGFEMRGFIYHQDVHGPFGLVCALDHCWNHISPAYNACGLTVVSLVYFFSFFCCSLFLQCTIGRSAPPWPFTRTLVLMTARPIHYGTMMWAWICAQQLKRSAFRATVAPKQQRGHPLSWLRNSQLMHELTFDLELPPSHPQLPHKQAHHWWSHMLL